MTRCAIGDRKSDIGMSVKPCPMDEINADLKQAEEDIMRLMREVTK